MKRLIAPGFILLAGLILIAGCAGKEKVTSTTPLQDLKAPEWVMKGSGAFGGDMGKVFYGVASASQMQNTSLLRAAADNRARNEVAKVFQFYTASLMKDYAASTTAGDPNAISEEQHVEQAIKTVTAMTLSGVEIVDHWQNPATGEFFALARLDLNAFKDSLDKSKELDSKVKDYIRQNAEKMHEQLEKEEAKMQAK
ncbi:MAG: LPP20 family lipoprotein [Nitrospirae bacterium]|nr:LPP20 family lipoprotein [Nitrospirota bacterium]